MNWYTTTSSTPYVNINYFNFARRLVLEPDFERQFNGDFERQLNSDEEKPKKEELLLFDPENLVL